MKIFLDSAILEEIEQAKFYGILDGVTTNPSLMKKAVDALKKKGKKTNLKKYISNILLISKGKPVSLEVTTSTYKEMVIEGEALFDTFNPVAQNVIIKIPINPGFEFGAKTSFDGLKAIKELTSRGIPVNCTLVFTPEQALLAAKAGAKYVSPFAGRIDDLLRSKEGVHFEKTDYFPSYGWKVGDRTLEDKGVISGVHLIEQCVEIFKQHHIRTEIIGASLRNPQQVREVALKGCHIATIPFKVLQQCIDHEKTVEGMKSFTADVVEEYANITKEKVVKPISKKSSKKPAKTKKSKK